MTSFVCHLVPVILVRKNDLWQSMVRHKKILLLLILLTAVGKGYSLSVWSKSARTGCIEVVRGTRWL